MFFFLTTHNCNIFAIYKQLWITKKVLRIRKYKSVLWKKYHNSGSYNDLCEYKKAKYSFEKN